MENNSTYGTNFNFDGEDSKKDISDTKQNLGKHHGSHFLRKQTDDKRNSAITHPKAQDEEASNADEKVDRSLYGSEHSRTTIAEIRESYNGTKVNINDDDSDRNLPSITQNATGDNCSNLNRQYVDIGRNINNNHSDKAKQQGTTEATGGNKRNDGILVDRSSEDDLELDDEEADLIMKDTDDTHASKTSSTNHTGHFPPKVNAKQFHATHENSHEQKHGTELKDTASALLSNQSTFQNLLDT